MALGKIQLQIITQLGAMGRLDESQRAALAARPDDLTGEALDKLLQDEFKVPPFPLLVANTTNKALLRALFADPANYQRIEA